MWTYCQSTGELKRDGALVARGYSGRNDGRNNPSMQTVRDVGPIPAGRYSIGDIRDTEIHGPRVMPLSPVGHCACGRSGFLIHGDSITGNASHGCIILPRTVRVQIGQSKDREIEVAA